MFIGIVGATGNIGQRVLTEAVTRGHHVTAFTRDAVLISCYQPGNAAADFNDTVARSIADPTVYASAARSLLEALHTHPRTRLIVVGGAGSLEYEPGRVTADDDQRLADTLEGLGLPREYAAAVRGHRAALDILRTSNRLWTYLSPAELI